MDAAQKEFIAQIVRTTLEESGDRRPDCLVNCANFPGKPDEGLQERLREHADDHQWIRFWRTVSETTAMKLATMLVLGGMVAAAAGVLWLVRVGGIK